MQTISINEHNDLYIDTCGNIAITQDINALADISKNKALTTLGEPRYNIQDGIPYFETVFTDTPKIDLFQAALIDAIENTENVQRVLSFDYTQNNGVFSYSLIEKTIYGEVQLNG